VAVTADGARAASASLDGTLEVWDVATGATLATFVGESSMQPCAVSPDGRTVVAGEVLGRVHFLRLLEAEDA